ncbi:UNVERIFIED_CONTAM: hypothetical protein Sradi_3005300 [Sesamum radiatum]|uniref:Retrotransposon gag domain-containing protein n=1 Tax=Sesamum radiatum TaxID=300843 RepID=A0AAW2S0V1_SESRA
MDHVGAVERPMMEYSFPTADGMISSVSKASFQANNFEIKSSIIQIIWSNWLQSLPAGSITSWDSLTQKFMAKYFPPAKTAKMLNDIISFVKLDRESLYDAWEYFKGMPRRCPHHELPVWRQVQTFYNGVTLANRVTIDAVAGGTIMKKLSSEAFNIIDEIAINLYLYGLEKTDQKVANINIIDAITTLSTQMIALTQRVDNLGAAIWNGASIGPSGACGQTGHLNQDCKMPSYVKFLKEVISNKRKWEGGETVKLNEECLVILPNKLPPKLKDPGSFSIPCIIENIDFDKALYNLCASVNLMSYSIFKKLGMHELTLTIFEVRDSRVMQQVSLLKFLFHAQLRSATTAGVTQHLNLPRIASLLH